MSDAAATTPESDDPVREQLSPVQMMRRVARGERSVPQPVALAAAS